MPKTVKVSISAIVKEIDKALEELAEGKTLAPNAQQKKAIAAKIKKIRDARNELRASCPKGSKSMTIVVPGA